MDVTAFAAFTAAMGWRQVQAASREAGGEGGRPNACAQWNLRMLVATLGEARGMVGDSMLGEPLVASAAGLAEALRGWEAGAAPLAPPP